jgi:hypothetical protein
LAPRYFILVGDSETWRYSLKKNLWGLSEHFRGYWNTSKPGDYLAFYVTSPIKKIIGFGKIERKFIDRSIIFPDEVFLGRPIWIYRYEYQKLLTTDEWDKGITPPPGLMLNVGRKLIDYSTFQILFTDAQQRWKKKIQDVP